MALDPDNFDGFREQIEEVLEASQIPDKHVDAAMTHVLDDVLNDLEDLIENSRPPRLYVFGRSGAGKSSLINALANKEENVAEVGSIEPETVESELYPISFPERYADWEIVDSRGLFESVPADGEVPSGTKESMREDLEEYRPDICIHVIPSDQVRAGREEFKIVNELRKELGDLFPPTVLCLNKVDSHLTPGGEWPPRPGAPVSETVRENLEFSHKVLQETQEITFDKQPFDDNPPFRGYEFDSKNYVGVIPTYVKEEEYWNVDTLSWLIGDFLPTDARLQFVQAQERENLMRKLAQDTTHSFSVTAAGIGAKPLPVADAALLLPLQFGLIGLIGTFSCRELELGTVKEYMAAMGITGASGLLLREVARALIQIVPVAGWGVSAGIAGGSTWAMGKSAEKYFFDDMKEDPEEFKNEGIEKFGE